MIREANWDFLKTVLMFFIVLGHLCPSNPDTWTPMTRVIGLFAITLFFFISGYFQTSIYDIDSLKKKYKKNFFRIIVPFISWGGVYVFISAFLHFIKLYNQSITDYWEFFKYTPFYILGFYWFLTALVFCQIIGSIISLLLFKIRVVAVFLLLLSFPFFCLLPPNIFEHYHFSFIWFFYGLGLLYKQLNKDLLLRHYGIFVQLSLLLFTIILIYLGTHFIPQDTFYFRSNLFVDTSASFIIMRLVLYTSISVIVMYWIMQIYRRFKYLGIIKTLSSWGVDTLFIYCSHMLFLNFVYKPYMLPYLFHKDSSMLQCLAEHMIGVLLSVLLYWGLQIICDYCKQYRRVRLFLMGVNC